MKRFGAHLPILGSLLLAASATGLAVLVSCGGGGGGASTPPPPPPPPPANTIEVGQGGFSFSPADITVKGGTVITFKWIGSGHSVVVGASCGAFSQRIAPVQNSGFTATFTTPIVAVNTDVPYYCEPHCGSGMSGVMHVTP